MPSLRHPRRHRYIPCLVWIILTARIGIVRVAFRKHRINASDAPTPATFALDLRFDVPAGLVKACVGHYFCPPSREETAHGEPHQAGRNHPHPAQPQVPNHDQLGFVTKWGLVETGPPKHRGNSTTPVSIRPFCDKADQLLKMCEGKIREYSTILTVSMTISDYRPQDSRRPLLILFVSTTDIMDLSYFLLLNIATLSAKTIGLPPEIAQVTLR